MNTTDSTPRKTEWPSGQRGWFKLASRCAVVTERTAEGYDRALCGLPADPNGRCSTHKGSPVASEKPVPNPMLGFNVSR